ncbi:MAG: PilZ domain-containing protein [Planctomycetota bacterium]|jgi:hypothetical protein
MTDNKPPVHLKERRLRTRWKIPQSLNAKVTVWTQQGAGNGRNEPPEQCWQGCLGNICESGAQIIVEAVCWERLRTHQRIKLQLDISSSETEIKTQATGQVRYIVPDEQDNRIKLGIEFSESALNADTKRAIHQVCEVAEPCSECKFDECPKHPVF